jgi:hypothetical protein
VVEACQRGTRILSISKKMERSPQFYKDKIIISLFYCCYYYYFLKFVGTILPCRKKDPRSFLIEEWVGGGGGQNVADWTPSPCKKNKKKKKPTEKKKEQDKGGALPSPCKRRKEGGLLRIENW